MGQITSVGNGKEFLDRSQLSMLRSVVQTEAHPSASHLYKFYSTMDIVDALGKHNWQVVRAQEQRVIDKFADRLGYQRHMLRFRQPGTFLNRVGDIAPEIVMTNAHDRTTQWSMMVGFFKLACLNGLIVSEGEFGQINIKHLGHELEDVIEASYKIIEDVPRLGKRVASYQQIKLAPREQEIFAEAALTMKYADNDPDVKVQRKGADFLIGERSFNLPALLRSVRPEDEQPSLWNVFNRVQEKMVKGNRFERTVHRLDNGRMIHKNKVPGINGINENLRINRGLWHLMDELAKEREARA